MLKWERGRRSNSSRRRSGPTPLGGFQERTSTQANSDSSLEARPEFFFSAKQRVLSTFFKITCVGLMRPNSSPELCPANDVE